MAYIRLTPYLSAEERIAFNKAWEKYTDPEGMQEEGLDPLVAYFAEGKSVTDCIHLATSNINHLLELAKPLWIESV